MYIIILNLKYIKEDLYMLTLDIINHCKSLTHIKKELNKNHKLIQILKNELIEFPQFESPEILIKAIQIR